RTSKTASLHRIEWRATRASESDREGGRARHVQQRGSTEKSRRILLKSGLIVGHLGEDSEFKAAAQCSSQIKQRRAGEAGLECLRQRLTLGQRRQQLEVTGIETADVDPLRRTAHQHKVRTRIEVDELLAGIASLIDLPDTNDRKVRAEQSRCR